MKFVDFWDCMKKDILSEKDFHTMKQCKGFTAKCVGIHVEIKSPSITTERNIPQKEFLRIWNYAKNLNKGEQFIRQNYNDITQNGSYILALMNYYLKEDSVN